MDLATGGELFDLLTTQEGDHFSEPFAAALMTQMLASVRELVNSSHLTELRSNAGYIKSVSNVTTVLFYTDGGEYNI